MLIILILLGILAGIVVAAVTPLMLRDALVKWRWRRAAKRLGLEFRGGSITQGDQVTGSHRGVHIFADNQLRKSTSLTLKVSGLDYTTEISARPLTWIRRPDETGMLTGDADFDQSVLINGPRDRLLAALNRSNRKKIATRVRRYPIEVSQGVLRYERSGVVSPRKFARLVEDFSEVVNAAVPEGSVPDILLERALDPTEPEAHRALCLDALFASHPKVAANATSTLEPTQPPSVRLVALSGLCGSSLKLRKEAIAMFKDRSLAPFLRSRALARLLKSVDNTYALPLLLNLAQAAAQGHEPHSIAEEVAFRLGSVEPDARVESALISLQQVDATPVRRRATRSLGRIGALSAVAPLQAIAQKSLMAFEFKRAVREAIAAIQTRHGGAGGSLSLTDNPDAGGLALTETQGALSAVEDEEAS